MQTAETALLFLQLIMRKLKRPGHSSENGGRAAVIVPDGTLFSDGIGARVKEHLLKNFNLHTILRLPDGVFAPYTDIAANILFFDRSKATTDVWFYEVTPPEGRKKYTKTKPLELDELNDCKVWWDNRHENTHAWKVNVSDVLKYDKENKLTSANLDCKNPSGLESLVHLPPEELIQTIHKKEKQIIGVLNDIQSLLSGGY